MNDDDRQDGIFDAPAKHAEPPAKVCGCGYPPHVGRCQPNTGTESEESTITSLAVIETASAALVYAPGALTALVDKLKQEVRAQLATLRTGLLKRGDCANRQSDWKPRQQNAPSRNARKQPPRAPRRSQSAALALLNISEEAGKLIIAAIAKGAVPHVTISY